MAKIIVSEFLSLDGVMEDPGGSETFEHGGWTQPYGGDDLWKFKLDELSAAAGLLLGRVTYQGFAAAWPTITDEQGFADRMNSLPKFVVSRTLTEASWRNSHLVAGDVVREVTALKERHPGDLLVAGSAMLVQALMRAGLVDQLRLLVYPLVLGRGKRLFPAGERIDLALADARALGSGVVAMEYRNAGSAEQTAV